MRKIYLFLLVLPFSCTSVYEINDVETVRILKTLSADNMAGRKVNMEGIEKAAKFIASEFKTIGLSEIESASGYRQEFSIISRSMGSAKVEIDNIELPSTSYFMRLGGESITWTNDNAPEVASITDGDDFREMVRSLLASESDKLVLVSDVHRSMFNMYNSYYSRARMSYSKKATDGSNVVFILDQNFSIGDLFIDASYDYEDITLSNIVGVIEGNRSDEIVMYSAHYDHLGVGDAYDGDSIYNGANDDASGTTAVIELARYFKSKGKPERTLMFAAFTAEEGGGFGSTYLADNINADEIVAMLNIEMIGKVSKEGLNAAWMTGWERSDLGQIMQNSLNEISYTFFADPYPDQNLFYRSDNASLAKLGVPAHSISTTEIDIDEDYHQLSDEFETLDVSNISNTIKAIAFGSQGIIDGSFTPTRIDPEQVKR